MYKTNMISFNAMHKTQHSIEKHLSDLSIPDLVEILQRQRFLFDHKANDFLQFLHILRLMQIVA